MHMKVLANKIETTKKKNNEKEKFRILNMKWDHNLQYYKIEDKVLH